MRMLNKPALLAITTFGLYALLSSTLKLAREEYSLIVTAWFRFSVGFSIALLWSLRCRSFIELIPRSNFKEIFYRSIFGCIGFLIFTYCAPFMPVSDMLAIQFAIPIILAILAKYELGEEIPFIRKVAILFGCIGVLLVARPTGNSTYYILLLCLAGSVSAALSDLNAKKLTKEVHPDLIALYFLFAGTLITAFLITDEPIYTPSAIGLIVLVMTGIIGAIASILLGKVFSQMPANAVAPFVYTSYLWSIIIDAMVWNIIPDFIGCLGALCIMTDGILAYFARTSSDTNQA